MSTDEAAIRKLISDWMAATSAGDVSTVLGMMTDDVVFLVSGREPFGMKEFAESFAGMKGLKIDGQSDLREIEVIGDHAWCRTQLTVTVTAPNGKVNRRAGSTMTIFRREPGGWRLARDANLLTVQE